MRIRITKISTADSYYYDRHLILGLEFKVDEICRPKAYARAAGRWTHITCRLAKPFSLEQIRQIESWNSTLLHSIGVDIRTIFYAVEFEVVTEEESSTPSTKLMNNNINKKGLLLC